MGLTSYRTALPCNKSNTSGGTRTHHPQRYERRELPLFYAGSGAAIGNRNQSFALATRCSTFELWPHEIDKWWSYRQSKPRTTILQGSSADPQLSPIEITIALDRNYRVRPGASTRLPCRKSKNPARIFLGGVRCFRYLALEDLSPAPNPWTCRVLIDAPLFRPRTRECRAAERMAP